MQFKNSYNLIKNWNNVLNPSVNVNNVLTYYFDNRSFISIIRLYNYYLLRKIETVELKLDTVC